jgi:hypothetical protein
MGTIYRKTEKGQTEITTRQFKLVPRLRSALILVDGKRNDEELRKLIAAQAEETLQALQDEGFIEVASVTVERPVAKAAAAGAAAASAATGPETRTPEESRRRAVRWIADRMGPLGDMVNMRIEAAKSPEELQAALLSARNVIRDQLGAARALEFQDEIITPANMSGTSGFGTS